jgi:hypothetical protein
MSDDTLAQWAYAEQELADAKASGQADVVRGLMAKVNGLRQQVRGIRVVGDTPDDKLLAAIFGGERIDLSTWRKYL